ncbi:MAG: hypothetical protein WEB85_08205 [Dongiaceae bacterium]
MKKTLLASAALAFALGISSAAMAQAPGNSEPGLDRYLDNLGRQQATEVGAQCGSGAGSGAFGFLGKDLNPGDPIWDGGNGTEPGTSGLQTGLNNSAVCGNRQGNLP